MLNVEFSGTVFRYERIMEVPLGTNPVRVKSGNVTWQVRRFPSKSGDLLADLIVCHPALEFSSDPDRHLFICGSFLFVEMRVTDSRSQPPRDGDPSELHPVEDVSNYFPKPTSSRYRKTKYLG